MNPTYYLFALFIFALLVVLIYLYVLITKPLRGSHSAISEKERRLFMLYQNLDEMMNSIEAYVEEAKSDIQTQREDIAALVKQVQLESQLMDNTTLPVVKQEEPTVQKEDIPLDADRLKKHEKVMALKASGSNIEQIAQELGISCGEVLLILEITKNNVKIEKN